MRSTNAKYGEVSRYYPTAGPTRPKLVLELSQFDAPRERRVCLQRALYTQALSVVVAVAYISMVVIHHQECTDKSWQLPGYLVWVQLRIMNGYHPSACTLILRQLLHSSALVWN